MIKIKRLGCVLVLIGITAVSCEYTITAVIPINTNTQPSRFVLIGITAVIVYSQDTAGEYVASDG